MIAWTQTPRELLWLQTDVLAVVVPRSVHPVGPTTTVRADHPIFVHLCKFNELTELCPQTPFDLTQLATGLDASILFPSWTFPAAV